MYLVLSIVPASTVVMSGMTDASKSNDRNDTLSDGGQRAAAV